MAVLIQGQESVFHRGIKQGGISKHENRIISTAQAGIETDEILWRGTNQLCMCQNAIWQRPAFQVGNVLVR